MNNLSLREYQATLPEIIQFPDKTPFISIDESKLDIFRRSEVEIPAWQPIQGVPEFDTCSYIVLDIETTGLGNSNRKNYLNVDFNPGLDVIKMIGMKSELGSYRIYAGNDEKKILRKFIQTLRQKRPNYLFTYNGWNFDIPFLIARLDYYNIKHPFKYARNPSKMTSAQMFGKPQIFHQIFLQWEDGKQTYIVDLYFQVLAWDFVARKLVGWSLKTVPVQMELREESERLELSYSEILECYRLNHWDRLEIYLKDDLDDTERVAHHLFPAVHYQQLIIPEFNAQQLHIYGNGSKLNKFLTNFYISEGLPIPDAEEAHRFKGGRTEAFCGFFKNTTKCDVASLYPTIMLNYGLCSVKDQINILLGALKYLTEVRLWHKANAKDESKSPEERRKSKQLEGAFKVIINSMYGFLGAKGLEFNDYRTAAMVTAYGRAILKFMMDHVLGQPDTIIVNMDTDAVAYSCPKGQERVIYESLKAALPEWVKIDFEWNADVFIPAVVKLEEFEKRYKLDSYHGRNFLQKWFETLTIAETHLCLMKFGNERVSLDLFFKNCQNA
jgi:DNA polymerase, archaea type